MIRVAEKISNSARISSDPMEKYPAMMTINQVAEAINVNRRTINRWEASGRIPGAVRRDRFIRFLKTDIIEWMNGGCRTHGEAA
jgi:excisionase family DNA binding protein